MREHKTFFLGSGFHLGSIKPTAPSSIDRALVPQLLPLLHKRPPVRVCALSNESGNLPPAACSIGYLRHNPDQPSDRTHREKEHEYEHDKTCWAV